MLAPLLPPVLNTFAHAGRAVCGVDAGVEQDPLWYPVSWTGTGKCMSVCPSETNLDVALYDFTGMWQSEDPQPLVCMDPDYVESLGITYGFEH